MSVTPTTQHEWFHSFVSALMSTIVPEPVVPDSDGDIPVHGDTAQAWVRVEAREPWGVRVFALAAVDVPAKAAVLREINAANVADRGVRVILTPNGSVMVDYLLFADAVTQDNLRAVIGRVLSVADEIGPVLAAVHGGTTPIAPQPSPSEP
jgi:hypothetical protein